MHLEKNKPLRFDVCAFLRAFHLAFDFLKAPCWACSLQSTSYIEEGRQKKLHHSSWDSLRIIRERAARYIRESFYEGFWSKPWNGS